MAAVAAWVAIFAVMFAVRHARHLTGGAEDGAQVWFYDQSSKRLYAAPRSLIPPDGKDDTRVRAVVIGFQGLGNNPSQLKIAYLEKYSPEFKALLERAAAAHVAQKPFTETVPSPNSAYYQQNAFIKRPDETSWSSDGTPEARLIKGEWHDWRGPNGEPPIISVPAME
jgi:hypothetical protein